MRTLIIDNYDSYTYNLYQLVAAATAQPPAVVRNDECSWAQIRRLNPDAIILSPGPGRPDRPSDFGICSEAIRRARIPLLGVCLGHQGIAAEYGARIERAPTIVHGGISAIHHNDDVLFRGIPPVFQAVRYHSLHVAGDLPTGLEALAWTDDGILMALRDPARPLWGVQFHPESIGTQHGQTLIRNFLAAAQANPRRDEPAKLAKPSPAASRPLTESPALYEQTFPFIVDAAVAFDALFADRQWAFWLDSAQVSSGLSRYSFMGVAEGPVGQIVTYEIAANQTTIRDAATGAIHHEHRTIFDYLATELERLRVASPLSETHFACGFVGYLGYELRAALGSPVTTNDNSTPDAAFILADHVLVFDHLEQRMHALVVRPKGDNHAAQADAWLSATGQTLRGLASGERGPMSPPAPTGPDLTPVRFVPALDRRAYTSAVEECQQALLRGDSYELCLTTQIRAHRQIDPLSAYLALRTLNPAPYAALLRLGSISVLSSSPERFLKITPDGTAEAKPIKGTRARGITTAADAEARRELEGSAKDRAENMMIVDLLRNDLGQVAVPGSVSVPGLMRVETYQTVHQLVSTIRADLAPGVSPVECVKACFPGGSMTGAPKLRSMALLDEIEKAPRGVYSGALGYLSLSGPVDLSIVIRTLVSTPHGVSIGAGGAVTVLSDPDDEYEEMLLKARAVMSAVALACTGDATAYRCESQVDGKEQDTGSAARGEHCVPTSMAAPLRPS